ncbi:L-ribulose-5-phosphate 3-epimerase [Clostridium grantii]|uniref:L-ribulose-5-phosphate 3-epimerase n=1 Tax=Clostridium grantii DSM 8605 TaxID=1121316 RepID=A0A1M5XC72_9CLOT|nr:L-ribulose-5-phosphate 3-epimerase [Clostridium grantii]SHH97376.1 L-xylulose 5-phosphate 3-epimerase [Clostridium grantii DSM 8605]
MVNLKNNPIGIYEKAMPNNFSWKEKIEAAKKAGFNFIEMSVDESDERLARLNWSKEERNELRDILQKNDFYINSMCLSGHRKYPFGSKNVETREKAYELMNKAIDLALDLGIKNIQLAGYDVYYEDADEETKKMFIEGLQYSAKKAASASVMLSIEIMDTEFIGTITRCLEYIDLVKSPWLKIYPDLGNLTQWCEEPSIELEKGFEHIVAVHLKDTKPGIFKCVPFGEGTVDFPKLLTKLTDLNYTGPFLVEMWADNSKDETIEETVKNIKSAKTWLQKRMGE